MRTVDVPMTAPQREFIDAAVNGTFYDTIGFDGPRGVNKTYTHCMAHVLRRLKYPGTKSAIIRRTEKSAVAQVRDEIKKICRHLGVEVEYHIQTKTFSFVTATRKSEIVLGHCRNEADYEVIQGWELTDLGFEEAPQHSYTSWALMSGSHRAGETLHGAVVNPILMATANAGNSRGQGWYKRVFMNPKTRDERTLRVTAHRYDAIPTLEQDPAYWRRLRKQLGMDETRLAQWLNNDWEAQSGTYFWFDETRLFRKVDIPAYARWYAGVDWGYWPDPFAVVWAAKWQDNNGKDHLHLQREYRGWRLDPDGQAEKSIQLEDKLRDDGFMVVPCRQRFGDHQAWHREKARVRGDIGRTIASIWANSGWPVMKATHNMRVPGWTLIRQLISHDVLTIDPNCFGMYQELTEAVSEGTDTKSTGPDIDSDCEDHLLSALRFMVVSIFTGRFRGESTDDYQRFNDHKMRSYASMKEAVAD